MYWIVLHCILLLSIVLPIVLILTSFSQDGTELSPMTFWRLTHSPRLLSVLQLSISSRNTLSEAELLDTGREGDSDSLHNYTD